MFKKIEVFWTDDLSTLKLLPFNRRINKQRVAALVESMRKHGFNGIIQVIEITFIDGVKGYYIADGQHRWVAAKQLGLPICFQIKKIKSEREAIEFVADLNSTSVNWSATNFLDSWHKAGIEEYVKVKQIIDETGLQLTPVLQAFLFSSDQKEYRSGTMKFTNEEFSRLLIKQMIELNQFLPSKAFCRRTIVKIMCNPKYDHKKMLKAIKDYHKLVGGFSENERQLRAELERLMEKNC